ncbi:Centromere protein C [Nymphon striatum]|nr:Centromere protein C [Nymphon striatum]
MTKFLCLNCSKHKLEVLGYVRVDAAVNDSPCFADKSDCESGSKSDNSLSPSFQEPKSVVKNRSVTPISKNKLFANGTDNHITNCVQLSQDSPINNMSQCDTNASETMNESALLSEVDCSGVITPKKRKNPSKHAKSPRSAVKKSEIRNSLIELSESDSDEEFSISSNLEKFKENVSQNDNPLNETIEKLGSRKTVAKKTAINRKSPAKNKNVNRNDMVAKNSPMKQKSRKKEPIFVKMSANENEEAPVRKSKRTRLPPLEHWKQERPIYRKTSSGYAIVGVQSPVCNSPLKQKRITKKKNVGKSQNPNALYNKNTSQEALNEENVFTQNDYSGTKVYNPNTGKEEIQVCIGDTNSFSYGPDGEEEKTGDSYSVTKLLQNHLFISGCMKLIGSGEKPKSCNKEYATNFYIIKGTLEVIIHDTQYLLKAGHNFLVPKDNCYSLKNISKSKAVLFYTCITGSDYRFSESESLSDSD